MGVHAFRPSLRGSPIADPLERSIAEAFGHRIVALRLKHQLSRLVVVERTGINWKRLRALEEARQAPCVHEVVKLAALYGVRHRRLLSAVIRAATARLMVGCYPGEHDIMFRGIKKPRLARPFYA